MTGNLISLATEALVAVLLIVTIGYCMILNSRLKRLRADESDLRATIGELVTATEIAERAIGGLKAAALDCDRTLANRMREAEHFSIEIAREIAEGQKVLTRIKQIATAVRKPEQSTEAKIAPPIAAQKAPPFKSESVDVVLPVAVGEPQSDATVNIGKSDVRNSLARLQEALTAKQEEAGVAASVQSHVAQATEPVQGVTAVPPSTQSRTANRIEELRAMAEQARERLKELRKVNTEKAA